MAQGEIVVPKVWRSELARLSLFFVLSVACVVLSKIFPWSVIRGELFSIGDYTIILHLPLFWLVPFLALASAAVRIYDVRYSIDALGLESRVGIISLNQIVTRIRFEDIRSIETEQTLMERLLDIGLVEMGTAATSGIEMVFQGVSSPIEIQQMIQAERDARIRVAKQNQNASAPKVEQTANM